MKREKIVIGSLIFIIIILYVIKQELLAQSYTDGLRYATMENQISILGKQNIILQEELLGKESYQYIYQEATEQGFIPATYLYLP